MTNAISIRDKLRNIAKKSGKPFNSILVLYGLERTVYRISISPYVDKFTLKGGIFLYALFDGGYSRVTTDIDLLANYISNDLYNLKNIFVEIFSIESNDALKFDLNTLKITTITEFNKYHGVNITIIGYLDKTRVPVSIDIGFDDKIYPAKEIMEFPVLLDNKIPKIYAYSVYSVIAEKFESSVSLGLINGRYKDFYDIYVLANEYQFDGEKLKNAIIETFEHRNTNFDDIVIFEPFYYMDDTRIKRWNNFIKKKQAMKKISFEETLKTIKLLLSPIVKSINTNSQFEYIWDNEHKKWI